MLDPVAGRKRDARHTARVDELTWDAVAGEYRVLQRRGGHRYSLDDVLTAWEAASTWEARCPRRVPRVLDLGCGIGSVLVMLAYRFPEARMVGIEAQEESLALARRSLERNGLADRVGLVLADLRQLPGGLPEHGARFDLITGTPPYFPPGTASVSPDPQRAHARIELRGGVEDYLAAAGAMVATGGHVVVCADARRPDRVRVGAAAAGLVALRMRDAIPKVGRAPLFTVWTLAPAGAGEAVEVAPQFVARTAAGARTAAYHAVRAHFGLGPGKDTATGSPDEVP